ncbi:MAG: sugar-binding domain-containing protein, partial [Lentisphaeria bacterium]
MTLSPRFISLDGNWQLAFGPQTVRAADLAKPEIPAGWPTIPATVPGNVELDLIAAGELPANLDQGNRIYEVQRYEGHQWWYRREFAAPALQPGQRLVLTFAGLDTLGTVWLNGHKLGSTANMLVEQRFDITDTVRADKANDLVVGIDSAVLEGRRHTPAPGEYAIAANWESLSVRKAPHMYGWDILPRLVSAGLWRSVTLEVAEPTRWNTFYLATRALNVAAGTAAAWLEWDFATDRAALDHLSVVFTLRHGGTTAHESVHPVLGTHNRIMLDIKGIKPWWPRGYGTATVYDATLELRDTAAGTVLATAAWRTGFRTVELRRTEVTTPEVPGEFLFVVNGQPIFIKGTNWVPLDALHSRDPQHLAGAMAMLADLNCNMIRCWGGNVYEDHAFFDFCDAAGILVWQDFALACALYPQTAAFAETMRAEAEAVIGKLRNHPSLALWAGNNEIDEAHRWSGSGLDPNVHDRLSREVLATAVRRQDPLRPYLPSSPYLGPEFFRRGGDDLLKTEEHLWGPRDDFKGPYYRHSRA